MITPMHNSCEDNRSLFLRQRGALVVPILFAVLCPLMFVAILFLGIDVPRVKAVHLKLAALNESWCDDVVALAPIQRNMIEAWHGLVDTAAQSNNSPLKDSMVWRARLVVPTMGLVAEGGTAEDENTYPGLGDCRLETIAGVSMKDCVVGTTVDVAESEYRVLDDVWSQENDRGALVFCEASAMVDSAFRWAPRMFDPGFGPPITITDDGQRRVRVKTIRRITFKGVNPRSQLDRTDADFTTAPRAPQFVVAVSTALTTDRTDDRFLFDSSDADYDSIFKAMDPLRDEDADGEPDIDLFTRHGVTNPTHHFPFRYYLSDDPEPTDADRDVDVSDSIDEIPVSTSSGQEGERYTLGLPPIPGDSRRDALVAAHNPPVAARNAVVSTLIELLQRVAETRLRTEVLHINPRNRDTAYVEFPIGSGTWWATAWNPPALINFTRTVTVENEGEEQSIEGDLANHFSQVPFVIWGGDASIMQPMNPSAFLPTFEARWPVTALGPTKYAGFSTTSATSWSMFRNRLLNQVFCGPRGPSVGPGGIPESAWIANCYNFLRDVGIDLLALGYVTEDPPNNISDIREDFYIDMYELILRNRLSGILAGQHRENFTMFNGYANGGVDVYQPDLLRNLTLHDGVTTHFEPFNPTASVDSASSFQFTQEIFESFPSDQSGETDFTPQAGFWNRQQARWGRTQGRTNTRPAEIVRTLGTTQACRYTHSIMPNFPTEAWITAQGVSGIDDREDWLKTFLRCSNILDCSGFLGTEVCCHDGDPNCCLGTAAGNTCVRNRLANAANPPNFDTGGSYGGTLQACTITRWDDLSITNWLGQSCEKPAEVAHDRDDAAAPAPRADLYPDYAGLIFYLRGTDAGSADFRARFIPGFDTNGPVSSPEWWSAVNDGNYENAHAVIITHTAPTAAEAEYLRQWILIYQTEKAALHNGQLNPITVIILPVFEADASLGAMQLWHRLLRAGEAGSPNVAVALNPFDHRWDGRYAGLSSAARVRAFYHDVLRPNTPMNVEGFVQSVVWQSILMRKTLQF